MNAKIRELEKALVEARGEELRAQLAQNVAKTKTRFYWLNQQCAAAAPDPGEGVPELVVIRSTYLIERDHG